jgi:hypothetical protein
LNAHANTDILSREQNDSGQDGEKGLEYRIQGRKESFLAPLKEAFDA